MENKIIDAEVVETANNKKEGKALGICSIIFALLVGVIGLALGIIGLCIYKKDGLPWKLALIGTTAAATNMLLGLMLTVLA